MTGRAPPERASFAHWVTQELRYNDTDRQGHVNNAVFATFCESGRIAFLQQPGLPALPHGCSLVLARLELDYLRELFWPGAAEVGTRLVRLGRSSVTLGQGIFRGEDCVATALTVVVLTDGATRRSTPWPEGLRAALGG